MKIIQLKNFEGYEHHCHRCGRAIKNAFVIGDDSAPLGADCVIAIVGARVAKREMKVACGRMKMFLDRGERLAVELGMTIERVEREMLSGTIS